MQEHAVICATPFTVPEVAVNVAAQAVQTPVYELQVPHFASGQTLQVLIPVLNLPGGHEVSDVH